MNKIFEKKEKKNSHEYFLSYGIFSKFWTLKFCNYGIPELNIVLKLYVWILHAKIADPYFFEYLPL